MTRDSARKSSMSNKMGMESMANMERTERTGVYERLAPSMRSFSVTLIAWTSAIGFATVIGLGALSGCASDRGDGEAHSGSDESGTEHGGAENLEIESDDREESGVSLALDDTYDVIRKGARLILRYDAESNAFVGTVQNTTESVLNRVRVEVHLSNGTELGPTTPVDLAPGESAEVSLAATEESFTGWTPHAEVGEGEHGSGGESGEGGEHGSGGNGGEAGSEHGSSGESDGEHNGGGEDREDGERGGEHGSAGEGDESGGEHGSGG